jgi:Phage portal protein
MNSKIRRAAASGQTPEYLRKLASPRAGTPKQVRDREGEAIPPGGFSFGSPNYGGSTYTDAFHSRRAPSPIELIENCKSLIYAMMARNRDSVSSKAIRLYADGSRAQGKPVRHCDPIRISRHAGQRLARSGMVSPAAVDQIYEVRTHPFLNTLDNPDGDGIFSRRKLIGLMVAYMDVVGQAFLVPEGKGWDWRNPDQGGTKGVPQWLHVIYPQYVLPYRDAGSPKVSAWQYFRDRIPSKAAIWFRHSISLRDAFASSYSPTYAGDQYRNQEDRFMSIFDQVLGGPRPSLLVSAKDANQPFGEVERKRYEQDINRKNTGGNAGGLLVVNAAVDVTPLSYSPADLAGMQISEYDRNMLAAIFGQPPTYYTIDTNLANLQAADEQYAKLGIEPRCDTIAEALTRLVKTFDPRLFMRFDPALPEDDEVRARVIDMKVKNGTLTINQANEEERWPAVPWGDEPWMAGTLVQPSMAIEKHQAGIEQGKMAVEQNQAKLDLEAKKTEWEISPEPDEDDGSDEDEMARALPAPASNPWAADADFLELSRTLMIGHVA